MSDTDMVDLDELLADFVNLYRGMKQRGPEWYASMSTTVGGSEIAALRGENPYKTVYDVAMSKVMRITTGKSSFVGGPSCWWGTLFEDCIENFVSIDLGSVVRGADICIQEFPGHRNSPDGYIVARFYRSVDGALHLWTSDMSDTIDTELRIVLLEFKCPISRRPNKRIPKQYRAQLWSGLSVSPVASLGLYIDAIFRKCSILDLNAQEVYDTTYHTRDRGVWRYPVAWGLIGVYAPNTDAPRHIRMGWQSDEWCTADPHPDARDADGSAAALQILAEYFGVKVNSSVRDYGAADLGDMGMHMFNRTLGIIDRKIFHVRQTQPCFADGRGISLHSYHEVCDAIHDLKINADENYYLVGVLPYKIMSVDYISTGRQPGFVENMLEIIAALHDTVQHACASDDPIGYMSSRRYPAPDSKVVQVARKKVADAVGADLIDDLFASISEE